MKFAGWGEPQNEGRDELVFLLIMATVIAAIILLGSLA